MYDVVNGAFSLKTFIFIVHLDFRLFSLCTNITNKYIIDLFEFNLYPKTVGKSTPTMFGYSMHIGILDLILDPNTICLLAVQE